MDENGRMSRKEACFFLGIREDAAEEQIKRAYHYKAKLYHPDSNPDADTREYYLKIQKAYEYLMNNPYTAQEPSRSPNPQSVHGMNPAPFYPGSVPQRPAKIFATDDKIRAQYQRQKSKEKELKKVQKWESDYKSGKLYRQQAELYGEAYANRTVGPAKSDEEEILEKIRAIWLAETIRRQISYDKEHKEALQRRKLYQAFMQQKIQEDDK
ncbi:MAG: DnaJ domain-containing protein [Roseburia sp.]|nr:DnaJ domain-containing protein [Roseburia sp.]